MGKTVYYAVRYLDNRELSAFDRVFLIFLLSYYNFEEDNMKNFLCIPVLYERMFGKHFDAPNAASKTRFRKKVISSLQKLHEQGIVNYIENPSKDIYQITYINNYKEKAHVRFSIKDVNTILQKTNSYILVEYFMRLLRSRNFKMKIMDKPEAVGYMPINFFAKSLDRSKNSIMNYNKQLEDLGIIYIRHSIIEGVPNAYGLMEDKEYVDEYYSRYTRYNKSKEVNEKRSLMQKYHYAVYGIKYSEEEIAEINRYIAYRNTLGTYPVLPLL